MAWKVVDRLTPTPPETSGKLIDDAMRARIEAEFTKYPSKRAALLTALHMVQDKYRCVSDQAMCELAEIFEISPAEVLDTMSFYDMYSRKKMGNHKIGVCVSLSCELWGGKDLMDRLRKKLGITPGQTTEDGKFSVVGMECIGACEYAPAILLDERLHKIDSLDQLDQLVDGVR